MQKATTNQYFMDSGSNVSFFFEEQAHDESGSLRQAKELSINKIGSRWVAHWPLPSSCDARPTADAMLHSSACAQHQRFKAAQK